MLPKAHKVDWEELAGFDPMWAVLSEKEKRGNKWRPEEFFKTGKVEIDRLWKEIEPLCTSRRKALDFGCGVGRLTRSLKPYFGEACGVDVSASMIERAKEYTPECNFYVNDADDLSLFADGAFDLVYSNIVLQHQPSPKIIAKYIGEFFRVTAPGGLVVFQVPSRKSLRNILNLKRTAYHLLKSIGVNSEMIFTKFPLHPMRMTAVPQEQVREIIRRSNGELIRARRDTSAHFAVFYYCRRS